MGGRGVGTAPGPGSVGSHRGKSTQKKVLKTVLDAFILKKIEIDFQLLGVDRREEFLRSPYCPSTGYSQWDPVRSL